MSQALAAIGTMTGKDMVNMSATVTMSVIAVGMTSTTAADMVNMTAGDMTSTMKGVKWMTARNPGRRLMI